MADTDPGSAIQTRRVFGFDFVDSEDMEGLAEHLVSAAQKNESGLVLTPNTDIMVHLDSSTDRGLLEFCSEAAYCLPDGQPVVWASRLLGQPLRSRLAGSNLFTAVWPLVKKFEVPVTMLLANPELEEFYNEDYWRVNCEVPDFFDANDEVAMYQVIESLTKKAALNVSRIVFCGVGFPKEVLIAKGLLRTWHNFSPDPAPMVMTLGAAFSMHAGLQKRAPEWMQNNGLEWFYRFSHEPVRLFSRYFVRSPKFLKMILRERSNPSS